MTLWEYDAAVKLQGYKLVCGVDEAGRGPLAGPVYAGAVILPEGAELPGLDDSKKLTEKKREQLYAGITKMATAWSVASADEKEIDSLNILQASLLAMRRAVEGLGIKPDIILADGNQSPGVSGIKATVVVKGDGVSACIAAASILAKVARDRFLRELDKQYPAYQFAKHKGYPTKLHYAMLDLHGPCPAHRESFLRKWRAGRE